ncbi:MAG: GAF domain-containing protein [Roseibacillus sp.]
MQTSPSEDPTAWLSKVATQFNCQTGTLHRSQDSETLQLIASLGVPEHLLSVIDNIPFGKGIAGAAAATREPVELCNLQKDLGGVAKEGARDTKVSGSLAVPIFSTKDQTVIGTLGIGMIQPYEFNEDEKSALAQQAQIVASHWENPA